MRVALSAWFTGRAIGSGQYLDQLHAALRTIAEPEESYALLHPSGPSDMLSKLAWEQLGFPRAARGYDLAHVPYWAPPLRPAVPTLVTVHDLIPLVLPDYHRRARVRAYNALLRRSTRSAAALLADSEHSARDIRRLLDVDPARVHVVPLGVASHFRPASPLEQAALRESLDLPQRFGLYLGGFDTRKNLETLLRAWVTVHRATGVPLLVAGRLPALDDPLHPHPLRLAGHVGLPASALRLPGYIADADLPALYSCAALLAFPSRYEGFGLTPLEAMACRTPVLVADATSLPEVVGEAGLRLPPLDPAAWSEALCSVLEDRFLASRLAEAGLARASGFTWTKTAIQTRAIYRLLLV